MTKQETNIEAAEVVASDNIFAAIACAASAVKVLGKSERNKFDGYDFVSIDKFLALVNPICSRNGLFPIVSQREVQFYENTNAKGGKSTWARFFYDVTLYHSSGATLGPTNIMVSVPMNGAQATGSAQSYALKQFFRSTLMIPTGDKDDADLIPTEAHQMPAVKTVSPDQYIKLRDKAVEAGVDEAKICNAADVDDLQQFPADQFEAAMKRLQINIDNSKTPEDMGGDEIPYGGPTQ